MKKKHFLIFVIPILMLFACNRDAFIEDDTAKIQFSTDTVIFDTIFTSVGSTTKKLIVKNPYKQSIKISNINLAKGKSSKYRLNIDGMPTFSAENIELAPEDSMYIFVEVTIDPGNDEMLEHDSIIFITNGNIQDVDLVSFGQDVHLFDGEILQTQTWQTDKPYLIYNSILVDSLHTLTIPAGVNVHFHKNSYLFVKGTLIVNGSFDEPVTFGGDRLENLYDNWPGQWGGIWLLNGSLHNTINYAEIKNAKVGVRIDTLIDPTIPTLFISNSKIMHHSIAGIYALGTYVTATNCVIANCGMYCVALILGGNYGFYHCTINNNWAWNTRSSPSLVFNNYLTIDNQPVYWGPFSGYFANSIIYGSADNEFFASSVDVEGGMAFTFDRCLMKLDFESNDTSLAMFNNCFVNENPNFISTEDFDYHLDTISPAKDRANTEIINLNLELLQFDIDQNNRLSDENPDIGAYERIE